MNKLHPGADLLNTKSSTYANRMWIKIMKSTIQGNPPIKFGTFHSDATTHKEIDDGRANVDKFLLDFHKTSLDYAEAYFRNKKINWENLGALSQKIGIEPSNSLIK